MITKRRATVRIYARPGVRAEASAGQCSRMSPDRRDKRVVYLVRSDRITRLHHGSAWTRRGIVSPNPSLSRKRSKRACRAPLTRPCSSTSGVRERIDDFSDLLGNLQPILGATEEAFKAIFRAPRSERKRAEEDMIRALDATIERVREAGVDIEIEDAMPEPSYTQSPLTLNDLHELVRHDL